jgi:hypothetical protein
LFIQTVTSYSTYIIISHTLLDIIQYFLCPLEQWHCVNNLFNTHKYDWECHKKIKSYIIFHSIYRSVSCLYLYYFYLLWFLLSFHLVFYTPSIPWYKVYNFLWKILKYKLYDEIVDFFLHNLGVNLIGRDKILRFSCLCINIRARKLYTL